MKSRVKRVPEEFVLELEEFKKTLKIKNDSDALRQMAQFSRMGRTMTELVGNPFNRRKR